MSVRGAPGGDALLSHKEAERLAEACKKANGALIAHLRQKHGGHTEKWGSWPATETAENVSRRSVWRAHLELHVQLQSGGPVGQPASDPFET